MKAVILDTVSDLPLSLYPAAIRWKRSMQDHELEYANLLAGQAALAELVRAVISRLCNDNDDDEHEFRRRVQAIEETAIHGLLSRRHFAVADDRVETYIEEAASGYISRLIGSVRHDDSGG